MLKRPANSKEGVPFPTMSIHRLSTKLSALILKMARDFLIVSYVHVEWQKWKINKVFFPFYTPLNKHRTFDVPWTHPISE